MLHFKTNNIFRFVDSLHGTRSSNANLIVPQFRTTLYKNSILCIGPKLFNDLPTSVKNLVATSNYLLYKKKLKHHILNFL